MARLSFTTLVRPWVQGWWFGHGRRQQRLSSAWRWHPTPPRPSAAPAEVATNEPAWPLMMQWRDEVCSAAHAVVATARGAGWRAPQGCPAVAGAGWRALRGCPAVAGAGCRLPGGPAGLWARLVTRHNQAVPVACAPSQYMAYNFSEVPGISWFRKLRMYRQGLPALAAAAACTAGLLLPPWSISPLDRPPLLVRRCPAAQPPLPRGCPPSCPSTLLTMSGALATLAACLGISAPGWRRRWAQLAGGCRVSQGGRAALISPTGARPRRRRCNWCSAGARLAHAALLLTAHPAARWPGAPQNCSAYPWPKDIGWSPGAANASVVPPPAEFTALKVGPAAAATAVFAAAPGMRTAVALGGCCFCCHCCCCRWRLLPLARAATAAVRGCCCCSDCCSCRRWHHRCCRF